MRWIKLGLTMEKEVLKIGNSLAVIIPSPVAKSIGLRKGDKVNIRPVNDIIEINRLEQVKPINLRGLVKPIGKSPSLRDFKKLRREFTQSIESKWKKF